MSLDADIAACAGLVARGDPARFRAAMAAPVRLRARLFPLYAFNLEVARAPWVTKEPIIAQMRLQWWRDALEEIGSGGKVRRHEVVTPLAHVLDPQGARDLDDLVLARHGDIEPIVPPDTDAIVAYVNRTAGTLLWTAARRAGAIEEAVIRAAGRAQGIAAYLDAVPDLVARGRHPLPHGDPADHAKVLAQDGLDALKRARATSLPADARPVLLVLPEAEAVLKRHHRDPASVVEPSRQAPDLRARASLAMRALVNRP